MAKTLGWVAVLLCAPLCYADDLSFSGTVLDDAVETDIFFSAVEIGDEVTILISVDLSLPPVGSDIVLPGLSGALTQYDLQGLGDMRVEVGSAVYTCDLASLFVGDNLVFPPNFPSPVDLWTISAGRVEGSVDCPDLEVNVHLESTDTNLLTNTFFFLPSDLVGFSATFTVNAFEIDPNTNAIVFTEAANGSIDVIVTTLDGLFDALISEIGLVNGGDTFRRRIIAFIYGQRVQLARRQANAGRNRTAAVILDRLIGSIQRAGDRLVYSEERVDTIIGLIGSIIAELEES